MSKTMRINNFVWGGGREISVIVQGPVSSFTEVSLQSIRQYLPKAEIVLSTWKGSNIKNLDFDVLVENEDPGCTDAFREDDDDLPIYVNRKMKNNLSRQIVSTLNGLKASHRKYALKLRSDLKLTGVGFLKYFKKFKKRGATCQILKERVITSICARKADVLPFHPGDWVFFGLKEDLLNIFDIPLPHEPAMTQYFYNHARVNGHKTNRYFFHRCQYVPEQWIWFQFLKKHISFKFKHLFDSSPENIWLTEVSFANNLVILPRLKFGIVSLKYPDVPDNFDDAYSYADWHYLYLKYCTPFGKYLAFFYENKSFLKKCKRLNKQLSIFLLPMKLIFSWILSVFNILSISFQIIILFSYQLLKGVYRACVKS